MSADPKTLPVGLLTLQGDYGKHRQVLHRLGRATRDVRRASELEEVSCLIIPGGESTTLTRLVDRLGLRDPLQVFAANRPVMGTCAGLIMLASGLDDEVRSDYGVEPLGLLDCRVRRNGYGRQIDSFTAPIDLDGGAGVRHCRQVRGRGGGGAAGKPPGSDVPSGADRRCPDPPRISRHDLIFCGRADLEFGISQELQVLYH